MKLGRCAHAHTYLTLFLLLSSQASHATGVESEDTAVDECTLLQTRVSTNASDEVENLLQTRVSTNASHEVEDLLQTRVSTNASHEVEKLSNTAAQSASLPANQRLSLWPLVLLVIGTVASFLGMVFYGHLTLSEKVAAETAVGARECAADHAKWLLSGFVCFSHLTQYYNPVIGEYPPLTALMASGHWAHPSIQVYTFIHFFMMQTFCFYSGLYSRSYAQLQSEKKGGLEVSVLTRKLQGNVLNILMVGEFMNIFRTALERVLKGQAVVNLPDLRSPEGAGWYIYALVIWRLILPTLMCVKYPIAASFLWAAVPSYYSMQVETARVFWYFPFFVMGWTLDPAVLEKTRSDRRVQVSGMVVLGFMMLAMRWPTFFQYLCEIYADGEPHADSNHWGILFQPMHFIVCSICTASFLVAGQPVFSGSWGPVVDNMSRRSLYNYLGHMTVLNMLDMATGWQGYMLSLAPFSQLLFSMCMSLLVLMILTSWPVYGVLSSVCEPNLACLFVSAQANADTRTSGV